jgi:uncharacterized protein (TIGR02453 family)
MISGSLFEGFSPEVISFLKDLKNNNNRDWFNAKKSFYLNEIKEKSLALINEMQYVFAAEDLPFDADLKKSLFRIYRDIRFSKDKSPYKTHIGMFFPYKAGASKLKPVEATGIYLHIEPGQCFIAGGLHRPLPPQLKMIRNRIAGDYEELNSIINDKNFKAEFEIIFNDESLKRIPQGFPKEHPAAELLKLKGYSALNIIPCDIIGNRMLIAVLVQKAKAMLPLLEYLHEAVSGNP